MISSFDKALELLKNNGFIQVVENRGFRFEKRTGTKKHNCEVLFFKSVDEMFFYLNCYLEQGVLK
jgi:hypothetical protein